MPGDPKECRFNAVRCLRLAKRARRLEVRQAFVALAGTWTRLAAELESDRTISELELSEPYGALPLASLLGGLALASRPQLTSPQTVAKVRSGCERAFES